MPGIKPGMTVVRWLPATKPGMTVERQKVVDAVSVRNPR
jgi:hypothetical protein